MVSLPPCLKLLIAGRGDLHGEVLQFLRESLGNLLLLQQAGIAADRLLGWDGNADLPAAQEGLHGTGELHLCDVPASMMPGYRSAGSDRHGNDAIGEFGLGPEHLDDGLPDSCGVDDKNGLIQGRLRQPVVDLVHHRNVGRAELETLDDRDFVGHVTRGGVGHPLGNNQSGEVADLAEVKPGDEFRRDRCGWLRGHTHDLAAEAARSLVVTGGWKVGPADRTGSSVGRRVPDVGGVISQDE